MTISAIGSAPHGVAGQLAAQHVTAAQTGDFLRMLKQDEGAEPGAVAPQKAAEGGALRDAFTQFVGQTLFGQTLAAMRKTVDKPAYFHGGQAEEIFQQQMDQHLVEHITTSAADRFIEPMFDLFTAQRNMTR